jgi:hypothetical protein
MNSHRTTRSKKTKRKTGRPPLFEQAKRTEFCATVRAGCSLRYAARLAGVKLPSVYYAARTDPEFAELLSAAKRDRDMRSVNRIISASEKSWRAAAWLLERAEPEHFALAARRKTDPLKDLGRRRFKQLVAEIVQEVLPKCLQEQPPPPTNGLPGRLLAERLAEIKAQQWLLRRRNGDNLDADDEDEDEDDADHDDSLDDPPEDHDLETDDSGDDSASRATNHAKFAQRRRTRKPSPRKRQPSQ